MSGTRKRSTDDDANKNKSRLKVVNSEEDTGDLDDVPASQIKTAKLQWLWENRLEWGSVAIVQGTKGAGKSTWLRAIAAFVTGGPPLPGMGRKKLEPGNVLWYSGEEPTASRVKPGLLAAGANIKRCFLADALGDDSKTLQLPNDCPRLRDRIILRKAKLVVIDPLFAFTDGTCDLEGPTVPARRFMKEIMRVAAETGATIILSRNNTKSTGNGALASGRGSGEIGNAARSVLHLAPFPDTADVYGLSVAACNTGAPVPILTYSLVPGKGSSIIKMVGTSDMTADELADGDEGSLDRTQLEDAKKLIKHMIPSGKMDSKFVKAKAELAMIGVRTLQRASKALGVRVKREGSRDNTVTYWHAPLGGYQ
jgi:putative DNA primase/helicase